MSILLEMGSCENWANWKSKEQEFSIFHRFGANGAEAMVLWQLCSVLHIIEAILGELHCCWGPTFQRQHRARRLALDMRGRAQLD